MRHPNPPLRGLIDARRVLTWSGWTVEAAGRKGWYLVTPKGGRGSREMCRMEVIRLAVRVQGAGP